jgi:hypothetical protein
MGKYGKNKQDLGAIIGITYPTFTKKLNNEAEFSMSEMLKIRTYFISLGENPDKLTVEHLFFTWNPHYSEDKGA